MPTESIKKLLLYPTLIAIGFISANTHALDERINADSNSFTTVLSNTNRTDPSYTGTRTTWCSVCKQPVPRLPEINDQYAHGGLKTIALSPVVKGRSALENTLAGLSTARVNWSSARK